MNIRNAIIKNLAFASILFSQSALSQMEALVATPAEIRNLVGTDIERLVEAAYPKYEQTVLEARLTAAAKELEHRGHGVEDYTLEQIEEIMGFANADSDTNEVDTANAYYGIDLAKSYMFAQHKLAGHGSSARSVFSAMEAAIRRQHIALFKTLSLPPDELMKVVFKRVLVQETSPNVVGNLVGEPRVRRGMTFAYRGFKGFPIEGSFIRTSSFTSKKVESFALAWPRFKLHPQIKRMKLAKQSDIKSLIVSTLKDHTRPQQELSLNMGIVFHQAMTLDGKLVHIPGVKVVLTPASQKISMGHLSEGGYEFLREF